MNDFYRRLSQRTAAFERHRLAISDLISQGAERTTDV